MEPIFIFTHLLFFFQGVQKKLWFPNLQPRPGCSMSKVSHNYWYVVSRKKIVQDEGACLLSLFIAAKRLCVQFWRLPSLGYRWKRSLFAELLDPWSIATNSKWGSVKSAQVAGANPCMCQGLSPIITFPEHLQELPQWPQLHMAQVFNHLVPRVADFWAFLDPLSLGLDPNRQIITVPSWSFRDFSRSQRSSSFMKPIIVRNI